MYELKNGILYRDGRACFGLGQSYYPSYHAQKVPVPEDGDRLGELKKDLRAMRDAGFPVVRLAALGETRLDENGRLVLDFPLPDAIMQEADKLGMATIVRLQGYSINLHGYPDGLMLDQNGNEPEFYWGWFVRNCLNHPGILEDNELVTRESARYFSRYKSLISYQIYNEAAYPKTGFYDYHPATVAAYRRWLEATGRRAPEAAAAAIAPRGRPQPGEDPQDWIDFRMFQTERMSSFLNHLSDVAKEGFGGAETLTCHMPCPSNPTAPMMGEDYFDIAERMDVVGITHYTVSKGPDFFSAMMTLDMAESAAALFDKHAWLIEYDARTYCPLSEWERETYCAVGAGFKGILYYQWRADYPFADSPEPNGFGMVWNDGSKTEKYDGAVAMTRQLSSLSPYIAESEKVRSHVGILYSQHAIAWADALENGGEQVAGKLKNSSIERLRRLYARLREQGIAADFVRAQDLTGNALGLQLLLIPDWEKLSKGEQEEAARFAQRYPAFCYRPGSDGLRPLGDYAGFEPQAKAYRLPNREFRLGAALDKLGIRPAARVECASGCISAGLLSGKDASGPHFLAALNNYDDFERPVTDAVLLLDAGRIPQTEHAVFITPRESIPLQVQKREGSLALPLPPITTGGYVILYNGELQQDPA